MWREGASLKNVTWPAGFSEYLFLLACLAAALFTQTQAGTMTGVVIDASGAPIPSARVIPSACGEPSRVGNTDTKGRYGFGGLPGSEYRLRQVAAKGFAVYAAAQQQLIPGGLQPQLAIVWAVRGTRRDGALPRRHFRQSDVGISGPFRLLAAA
jgi:hypothetical protein